MNYLEVFRQGWNLANSVFIIFILITIATKGFFLGGESNGFILAFEIMASVTCLILNIKEAKNEGRS